LDQDQYKNICMTSKLRSISPRIYVWGCLRVLNATVGKISENKNAIENVYYFHDEVLSAVVAFNSQLQTDVPMLALNMYLNTMEIYARSRGWSNLI